MNVKRLLIASIFCCLLANAEDGQKPPVIQAPVTDETPTPPAVAEEAKKHIAVLTAEGFDERDAAAKALKEMDVTVLPWLKRFVADDASKLDAETRTTLVAVIKALDERNDGAVIQYGTPVKLALKEASATEVIAAIEKQAGFAPPRYDAADTTKRDFTFEGSYWGALAEMAKIFPLKAADANAREVFPDMYTMRRGEAKTFDYHSFTKMSLGRAGVCAMRVARVAYEQEASGRFITFTIVPHFESRYRANKLRAKIESVILNGGTKLEPLNSEISVIGENDYRSGDLCVVTVPVKEGLGGATTVNIAATLELEVFEMRTVKVDLSKPGPYQLGSGATMTTGEKNSNLTVKVSGTGVRPRNYHELSQGITLLDPKGDRIDCQHYGTSSGGMNNGWYTEMSLNTKGVKPSFIEMSVPQLRPKVNIPVTFEKIPLPVGQ
jgi:hypothetical protein